MKGYNSIIKCKNCLIYPFRGMMRRKYMLLCLLFTSALAFSFYSRSIFNGCQSREGLCHLFYPILEAEGEGSYLVETDGCRLIEMNPFHKSVQKHVRAGIGTKCSQPPVHLIKERLTWTMNSSSWERSLKNNVSSCCYRTIKRIQQDPVTYDKHADSTVKIGDLCIDIPLEGIDVKEEFIKIECQNEFNVKTHEDFAAQILPPQILSLETMDKHKFWKARDNTAARPPNILVIGIDSTSRMHMIRSLPKTRKFLLANDFIELKGFTKTGGNTFPNIMAGFAGMGLENYGSCWNKSRTMKLDDCPLIWKKFGSDLKYVTGFVEDAPGFAIFNYFKAGFVKPPADYYLRPLMVANDQYRRLNRNGSKVSPCFGSLSPTKFLINYMKNFIRVVDSPYFLFSWFTSAGHDDFNGLKTVDYAFQKFISKTVEGDVSNNTVILFISDHGYRFGPFRETFLGYYEESLPFFFFRLPPTLKDKFPNWYENLRLNSNRLTTPFDLYSTLVDLYHGAQGEEMEKPNGGTFKFNQTAPSFFEVGALDRSCDNSRIPSMYYAQDFDSSGNFLYTIEIENETKHQTFCRCGLSPKIGQDSNMSSQLGRFVVDHINHDLSSLIQTGICSNLTFSNFEYSREISVGEKNWINWERTIEYKDYLIALMTLPGKAKFEAKVRVFDNSTQVVLGDVNRINSYEGQSDCIEDYRLKNYCNCRNRNQTI